LKFLPFYEARAFVRMLKLKNQKEWTTYCKTGNKPAEIPYSPDRTYKKEWKGIGDWLGTGTIANRNRTYLLFEEAKKIVHSLKLVLTNVNYK
jgi:hypothetical protein